MGWCPGASVPKFSYLGVTSHPTPNVDLWMDVGQQTSGLGQVASPHSSALLWQEDKGRYQLPALGPWPPVTGWQQEGGLHARQSCLEREGPPSLKGGWGLHPEIDSDQHQEGRDRVGERRRGEHGGWQAEQGCLLVGPEPVWKPLFGAHTVPPTVLSALPGAPIQAHLLTILWKGLLSSPAQEETESQRSLNQCFPKCSP